MYLSEKEYKKLLKNNPKLSSKETKKTKKINDFDSLAEENFYCLYLKKYIDKGFIIECNVHNSFVILEALPQYKLKNKKFTPDFIIKTKNNETFVVEMKGSVVKKLQRDYNLRKHLFIEKYCIPNNWFFIELKSEDWTQNIPLVLQEDYFNFKKERI